MTRPALCVIPTYVRREADLDLVARCLPEFGPGRCLSVPFSSFDTYPAAMALFDVALALAGPAETRAILADLVADAGLRDRVGAAARAHVAEPRSAEAAAEAWREVLLAVAPAREAAA